MILRTFLLLIGAVLLLNPFGWAQTSTQSSTNTGSSTSVEVGGNAQVFKTGSSSSLALAEQHGAALAPGTVFNAALVTSLDSRKIKPGDQVVARTTDTVRAQRKTILPKGTKIVGHVTRASARAKGDSESAVGIVFDQALLNKGEVVPVNVTIQALASAQGISSTANTLIDTMPDASAGAPASGVACRPGLIGSATSTAGVAAANVTNSAEGIGGATNTALHSTANPALTVAGSTQAVGRLNAPGQLTSDSHGVFDLKGLSLDSQSNGAMQESMIASAGKNIHLDSGTRMLLVTHSSVFMPQ